MLELTIDYSQDPAVLLANLRARRAHGVRIICPPATTTAQKNYLRLFEEFRPIFEVATPTASTAQEGAYDLSALETPVGPFLPVSGEWLQGMMDYTVASKEMTAEYGEKLTWEVPADRHLFIEAPWPEEACHSARSLFAYPAEGVGERIAACDWPNLKLLLIHNSDTSVPHSALECLLDKYPALTIWLVNNKGPAHPRIKTVPLFEQNRRWRGGTADYTPPITLCRMSERSVGIFVPPCATTNPIRPIWLAAARKMRQRLDLEVSIGRMSPEDFYEKMEDSVTVLCPPGNGADTHRHWETLVKGAWPIVQRNEHTERLLDEYPSLPLIAIEDIEELRTLELPREVPCPFHPMLLREYWRVLFRSYVGGF